MFKSNIIKIPSARQFGTTISQLIQIQLFLTLISLPVLISWGLPVSVMAPVANLTLGPVLALFLGLSFIIFWCELLHIPNSIFIYVLDKITTWWTALLNTGSTSWLVGFAQPSLWLLIIIPAVTIALILHKKINSPLKMTLGLSVILAASYGALTFMHKPPQSQQQIACNKGNLTIIYEKQQLVVIDPGYFGQRISTPSWVEYTFVPHLYASTGAQTIDHLIIMQPGKIVFDALTVLVNTIPIKKVYLPFWQGMIPKYEWWSFAQLKAAAKQQGTQLIRIVDKPATIELSEDNKITIEPLEHRIKTKTMDYPAVRTTCNNHGILNTFYSVKYKNSSSTIV